MSKNFTPICQLFVFVQLFLVFHAAAQPVISSFSPASGPAGTNLTISGTGFNPTASGNIVYFGAVRAAVTGSSATSLTVIVPTGATYEPLSVLNTATSLTGYAPQPFAVTFVNPSGTGLPADYYQPRVAFPTDYAASFVTTGDLDGDGKPDLIVAGFVGVSVYRNVSATGSVTPASFANRVNLASSSIHDVVVVKDLDGDGKLDIAGASGYYNTLTLWRNNSTPGNIDASSFQTAQLALGTSTMPYGSSLTVADFDGDGKPDLASLNPGLNSVSVFRNISTAGILGVSSFAPRVDVPTAGFLNTVTTGDVDGDGKPDLITAHQNLSSSELGFVSVMRNLSHIGSITAASFAPHVDFAVETNYRSLAVGDVDGDGKSDVVTRASFGVSVLRNTANPGNISSTSFQPRVDLATSPGSLSLGDVDGDGKLDILTTQLNAVSILRNTAIAGSITSSSFAAKVDFPCDNAGSGITLSDLDGDGIAEVVITNNSTFSVSVLRANASSLSSVPQISTVNPLSSPVGSTVTITGSGFNATPSDNMVLFGTVKALVTGGSATSLTVIVPPGTNYQPVSVLNGANGLTGYSSKPFVTTSSNPYGTGIPYNFYKEGLQFASGTLPYFVALGDLNGDGKPDMVEAHPTNNIIVVRENRTASGGLATTSFLFGTEIPVGNEPRSIAIGDLDGDGKPDVVVANAGSSTISVLQNTSSGTAAFGTKVDFPTGSQPFSVTIGDIDLDGKPDILVANLAAGTVSVLRNTAKTGIIDASSFAPRTDFEAGNTPRYIIVSDLDADGKPDIAVANEQSNTVSVLRSTVVTGMINASSFGAPRSFATGNNPNGVVASDIDGDGKPDLVVANFGSNTVSVLHNDQTVGGGINFASFIPRVDFATGVQPFAVAAGDLDGDGKPDIATANAGSTNLSVLRNTAAPNTIISTSLAPRSDFAAGNYPVSIAIGDLDGNGLAELVSTSASPNNVSVRTINSPQPIVVNSFSPASGPVGTTVTINGNGYDPVYFLNQVFFGAVKAEITGGNAHMLQVKVPAGATYYPISVSKNNTELAAYSPLPFVTTFSNPFGTGIPLNFYRQKVDLPVLGPVTYGVAFGDINQDGKPDLITVNESSNTLSLMRNNSSAGNITSGSFDAPVKFVTAPEPRAVAFADIDGYAYQDVVVLSPAANTISVFQGSFNYGQIDANTFASTRKDFSTGGYASSFAVGDLDGDGRPELVLTNPYAGTVTVLRNLSSHASNGPTVQFAAPVSFPVGNFPRSVAVADVNRDGKPDIIVANEKGNTVSVLRNNSVYGNINPASFSPATSYPTGSNPNSIAIGDVDGDSMPDIVVANYGSNSVSVLRNNLFIAVPTTVLFEPRVDFPAGTQPYAVTLGDADGDGKIDLITANSGSNSMSVLRNKHTTGTITASSFADKADFSTGIYPLGLAMGDLDGDGIAEVATANAGPNAVSVFKVNSPVSMTAQAAAPVMTTTGIQETAVMQIYPNPTQREFTMRLQGLKDQAVNVEILTESGKLVERRRVNTGGKTGITLKLGLQASGVYYVKVTGVNGVQVMKVVVQR
ncbi:MAG: VCBS repeat-containing protein [Williamsia sp.]|nr:VCBS repeat-containing protein [Williamsia sp.]